MTPFFHSPERKIVLAKAAWSWMGTPFAAHSRAKGAGVDCVQLAGAIYIETGFLGSFDPPPYQLSGGRFLKESAVEKYLRETGRFEEHNAKETSPLPGDLLCFRVGRVTHHVGIFLSDMKFIHVHKRMPVGLGDLLDSTYATVLEKIFIPMEVAS